MDLTEVAAVLVIAGLIMAVPIWIVAVHASAITLTVTVKEKWVKGAEQQLYLFSDTDGNVYAIADAWELWNFDASNRWARLEEGKTYLITFYKWRIPILSWYQTAIYIEEI